VAPGAPTTVQRGHGDTTVNRASFSPDARLAITSSDDHLARLWDVATGQLLRTLAHPDRAMSAAWTRDGRVVTACWDKHVRVWEVATGRLVRTIALTTEPLDVAVAPDQHRFATADHDGQVELWNLDTGERVLSFQGHTGAVTTVAWSPDGALVASSGYDQTARIWDPATGKQLGLRMHRRGVMQIVWTPDGRGVLTAGEDGAARLWDVHRDERVPAAIAAYARDHAPYRLVDGRLEFVPRR